MFISYRKNSIMGFVWFVISLFLDFKIEDSLKEPLCLSVSFYIFLKQLLL